ncbi:MAG: CBS domain-containing protein, partial [Gammaproteobacteria bacterium]|nr:CBS domain-containing protein [Gammaproteobacteria bacterium]
LRRSSVLRTLDDRIEVLPSSVTREKVEESLTSMPRWIVILDNALPVTMLPGTDLTRALSENLEQREFNLLEIPALRREVIPTQSRVTQQHALSLMQAQQMDALAIMDNQRVIGIVTREDIEAHYRYSG